MGEYEYFRNRNDSFLPKTPIAALKAYHAGYLPINVFVYKSGSTKPLDEIPYDIEEIERLLSRENLGLETNIVLIGIFEDLIFSEDQEMALFAAESINIIENRYNKQIEGLKKKLESGKSCEITSKLARLFYELAILNRQRELIKKFFLRESYQYFTNLRKERKLVEEELNTIVRILLELKLNMNAANVIQNEFTEETVAYLFLDAEIRFAMGDYVQTRNICRKIQNHQGTLTEKERATLDYWLGV